CRCAAALATAANRRPERPSPPNRRLRPSRWKSCPSCISSPCAFFSALFLAVSDALAQSEYGLLIRNGHAVDPRAASTLYVMSPSHPSRSPPSRQTLHLPQDARSCPITPFVADVRASSA